VCDFFLFFPLSSDRFLCPSPLESRSEEDCYGCCKSSVALTTRNSRSLAFSASILQVNLLPSPFPPLHYHHMRYSTHATCTRTSYYTGSVFPYSSSLRRFPTVERRARSLHGTDYATLPADPLFASHVLAAIDTKVCRWLPLTFRLSLSLWLSLSARCSCPFGCP
jgi:hypothetical protein